MVDYTRVELEFLVGFAERVVVETNTIAGANRLAVYALSPTGVTLHMSRSMAV